MSGSSDRGEATRGRILAATAELIAEAGWSGFSTRDIAARAGVTQGVVSYHWRSKDDLVQEAALGATRPHGYRRAKSWRVRGRRGHQRAVIAVAHGLLEIIHHVLSTGELYSDLGSDYFERRQAEYLKRRAIRQLERLGHHVTLTEAPTPQPA